MTDMDISGIDVPLLVLSSAGPWPGAVASCSDSRALCSLPCRKCCVHASEPPSLPPHCSDRSTRVSHQRSWLAFGPRRAQTPSRLPPPLSRRSRVSSGSPARGNRSHGLVSLADRFFLKGSELMLRMWLPCSV